MKTSEQRLAEMVCELFLQYGGDDRIDKVAPRMKPSMHKAVALLEELGYWKQGQGFDPDPKCQTCGGDGVFTVDGIEELYPCPECQTVGDK